MGARFAARSILYQLLRAGLLLIEPSGSRGRRSGPGVDARRWPVLSNAMNSTINLADCADIVNCENRMSGIGTADVLLVVVGMGLIAVWMVMLPIALCP